MVWPFEQNGGYVVNVLGKDVGQARFAQDQYWCSATEYSGGVQK